MRVMVKAGGKARLRTLNKQINKALLYDLSPEDCVEFAMATFDGNVWRALRAIIRMNNLEAFKILIVAKNGYFKVVLMAAIASGNIEMVKVVLGGYNGRIHGEMLEGVKTIEMMRFLMGQPGQPGQPRVDPITKDFLRIIAFSGKTEILEYLLSIYGNVNFDDGELLRVAAEIGNIEMARMLVSLGVDPEFSDALSIAADHGHTEMFKSD